MSRSFMDSIRSVVTEGAKEKTADGMTKDAKNFRADLHTIKDSGMKHLVQKDSETKDYEKMFNGNVDHAKSRLADQQAPEDLNKYVEYNEEAELEEAKAKEEKHDEDCECEDCSTEVNEEIVNEAGAPMPRGAKASWQTAPKPGPQAAASVATSRSTSAQPNLVTRAAQNLGMPSNASQIKPSGMSGNYPRSAQNTTTMAQQTKSTGSQAVARIKATKAAAGQQARMGGNPTGAPNAPANRNLSRAQAITKGREAEKKAEVRRAVTKMNAADARRGNDLIGPSSASQPVVNKTKAQAITQRYAAQKKAQTDSAVQKLKSPMVGQGTSGANAGMLNKKPVVNKFRKDFGLGAAQPGDKNNKPATEPRDAGVKIVPTSGPPPADSAQAPAQKKTTASTQKKQAAPAQPSVSAAKRREARIKLDKGAVGPETKELQNKSGLGIRTGKVVKQRPSAPQPRGKAARDAVAAPKRKGVVSSSFEIDVNGTSYLVSEAHASAIAAFVEKYGEVNEGTAGEFISKEMKHPEKLTAKGKKQKIKQALAIYYSKKRRGENP